MSLTLGEKLRQAREERGISISEVAEQTRISAHYLDSIENDDYRTLPGGIFNKGFVKSYAKLVGIDEQEALQDYARLIASQDIPSQDEQTYRPEVLTDDRTSSSVIPTVIFAVIILGLMSWGLITLLRYINENPGSLTEQFGSKPAANSNTAVNTAPTPEAPTPEPFSGSIKVEMKAVTSPVSLSSVSDGKKGSSLLTPQAPAVFEPKDSLVLSYSKDQSQNVALTLNGKQITLPSQPASPKRNAIEVEINKSNAEQIFQSGTISVAAPSAPGANTNISPARL